MKAKITGLHPLLILLAVALASVLFVAACGGGAEPTTAPVDSQAAADEAAAAIAAAEAATAKAMADAEAQAAASAAELADLAEKYEQAAAGLASEATAADTGEGEPQYGGTLKVTLAPNFTGLDPLYLVGEVGIMIHGLAYDNLLQIQPDLSTKPELATSWVPNDDFTSYTFNLRKGVKFHHGKEFKAEDVVFTYMRWIDPVIDSSVRSTFDILKGDPVIVDDYTVRFDLEASNSFFPTYFSIYQARILPADVDLDRLNLEEFGTGPFVIEENFPNERVVLARNPNYWEEGHPYLDEIVILSLPEPATRDAALKSGDVDLIYALSAQSVPGLTDHPDTRVLNTASFSHIAMPMPTDVPPFDNVLVRRAFQAAMDREAINQAALLGLGQVARDHPLPPQPPRFRAPVCTPGLRPRASEVAAGAGRIPGRG